MLETILPVIWIVGGVVFGTLILYFTADEMDNANRVQMATIVAFGWPVWIGIALILVVVLGPAFVGMLLIDYTRERMRGKQ